MTLIDEVIERLQSYFDSGRNRNMATLVRKTTGVSYSTIRRLMLREVSDPSIENTIVPLLSNFMRPSEIAELIAPYRPEWAASFYATIESDRVVLPPNPEFDHVDFFIMGLSSHAKGTTREAVARRYGEVLGLGRLEFLLEENILEEVKGRIYVRYKRTTDACPMQAIKRIEASAKWFDVANLGKGAAFFNQLEYQSQDEYEKTHEALARLVRELKVIRENSVGPKDRLSSLSCPVRARVSQIKTKIKIGPDITHGQSLSKNSFLQRQSAF